MLKSGQIFKITKAITKNKPFTVFHSITFKCNKKCSYCGLWKLKRDEMNTNEIKSAMDFFSENGVVFWSFTGGEPLLRNDIGELIKYAKSKRMVVSMTTNGILVKEKIKDLVGLNSISFSIDSIKEVNDGIRGKGFNKILEGIKEAKDMGLNVSITAVLHNQSIKHINCFLGFIKKTGIPVVFQPVYKDRYTPKSLDELNEKQFAIAIDEIKKFKTENRDLVINSMASLDWFTKILKKEAKWRCYAGRYFCWMFPDGKVSSCWFREEESVDTYNINRIKSPKQDCVCSMFCNVRLNQIMSIKPEEIINSLKRFRGVF